MRVLVIAASGAIGARLGLPVTSVTQEDAVGHFGWLGMFAGVDMPASSQITQDRLGWRPTHTGLIEDIATAPVLVRVTLVTVFPLSRPEVVNSVPANVLVVP